MKLEKILDKLNTIEKTSFAKIIVKIISERPKNYKEVDKILSSDFNLKSLDSHLFSKVFGLINTEYYHHLESELNQSVSQLDILLDILIRDGNCIMSREWLGKLYEKEVKNIRSKLKKLKIEIQDKDITDVEPRLRDFIIYKNCIDKAYNNDIENNQDPKITADEKSILNELAQNFDLSQEEIKLLNYSILPLKTLQLEEIIELLKSAGIILYSKKNLTIYIPDEFVRLLRKYRNKEVADKYLKRILRLVKDPEINLISKRHGINRKLEKREKIRTIINEGIGIRNILKFDIHKDGTNLTAKKERINNLVEKGLNINHLKGTTIDLKIDSLVNYFNEIEKDEKVGISIDGYERLIEDLNSVLKRTNTVLRNEFELQKEEVSNPGLLLDYNIKPRDVLEIFDEPELKKFCEKFEVSTRGNEVLNILNNYKDSKNLELENYVDIASRNLIKLKENGVRIKESEIGSKFEELTKQILSQLGLNVDEQLRVSINTSKDKVDILLSVAENEVIIIECKTLKESGYNKFSTVFRQISAYKNLLEKNDYHVVKTLLIAPDFSDDFINETEKDYTLNLSLIRASSLLDILNAFKGNKKIKEFPHILFMRDVIINEQRIIEAIG